MRMKTRFYNLLLLGLISLIVFAFGFYYVWYDNFKYSFNDDSPVRGLFKIQKNFSSTDITIDDELNRLFQYMYSLNAIVVDKSILEIFNENNEQKSKYNIKQIVQLYQQNTSLTFGLCENDFKPNSTERIKNELLTNYKLNCTTSQATSNNTEIKITNVYIQCYYTRIQIAVFYKRGNFYWIGDDAGKDVNNPNCFGDTPRSLNQFTKTTMHEMDSLSALYVPISIKQFLYEYKYSKFIECDREAAKNISSYYTSSNSKISGEKKDRAVKVMNHIASTAERFQKKYMLYGGSLLGWYRDCGIIPSTHDIDFGMWGNEIDQNFVKSFIDNQLVHLQLTFGKPEYGYEMRLTNDELTFDIFHIYDNPNDTRVWTPYYMGKTLYRQLIEPFELCSGEVFGFKFLIVCDIVSYLEKEFGQEWRLPPAKNFKWLNVDFKNPIKLSDDRITRYNFNRKNGNYPIKLKLFEVTI